MEFDPRDAVKLQFTCERPAGGSIKVAQVVTASQLGLTGGGASTAPVLTAEFNQEAFLAAMTRSQDSSLTSQERADATADCLRLQSSWQNELASQVAEGATGQGESVANAVVAYLVAGKLKDENGKAVVFSESDASAYVIKASELNVGPRVEVPDVEGGEPHGFFVCSATATWG